MYSAVETFLFKYSCVSANCIWFKIKWFDTDWSKSC